MIWFIKSGLVRTKDDFMDLTLPQLILMKHYYYKEDAVQVPKKYVGADAVAEYQKFMRRI